MSKMVLSSIQMINRLAWRSLWRQRRRTFITISSIGLGLAVAIFFVATGEGVYNQVINDGVRMQAGHITLEHPQYRIAPAADLWITIDRSLRENIEQLAGVERTKLLVLGQGIAKSGSGAVGVGIMGVEPEVEQVTSPLPKKIIAGMYLDRTDVRKVVIGSRLAEHLKLRPGKKLVISSNNTAGDLVEELCRVKGIFQTGSDEIDGYFVQIPINFARRLFGLDPDSTTQLAVVLHQARYQARTIDEIRRLVAGKHIAVYPWQVVLPEVAAYIRVDRASNWVFQALLMVIILFTIMNTLLMSAVEREHEFAVLMALGTPVQELKVQLLLESIYLALMGCGIGALLGGCAAGALQVWGLDLGFLLPKGVTISGLAVSTRVHAKLTLSIVAWTGGLVLVATLFLATLPMRRLSRIRVAQQLR